jgi:hypothetical protein
MKESAMQNDDIRSLWQAQGSGDAPLTLEELRKKGAKFRTTIARRNLREYAAVALMAPYFSYFAWTARLPLMRVGNGLLAAALLYMAYQLHRRASASPAPEEMAWKSCLAFHRSQLERQRDALRGIWSWYLGPLIPGFATVAIAISIPVFRKSIGAGLLSFLWVAIPAVVLWQVARINKGAAAKIQRQIDELEAVERNSNSGAPE